MKIKIPPYPNFTISEKASGDLISKSVVKDDSQGLSNHLIMLLEFDSGNKRIIKVRPVRYKKQLYVTAFPNPVHLFLSVAIEHYNHSESIKEQNFINCGQRLGNDVFLLPIEENGTHDCYNRYIKYRASSIIMLVSALEAFLNHIIPNDFIYKTVRKEKPIEFNKKKIESAEISFNEKLTKVIPQWLKKPNFWESNIADKNYITELYDNRKNIIHLKTNSEDDFERYFNAIDKMLDLEILNSINATIKFMNHCSLNFVECEKE